MKNSKIYPVIHYLDMDTTMRNVEMSIESECDGIFLIHMEGKDEFLGHACKNIKDKYKNLFIGINRLSIQKNPSQSVFENIMCGADATWVDNCGINDGEGDHRTSDLMAAILHDKSHKLFASVAFKYQAHDNHPVNSARLTCDVGFIPTTSGPGTGHAPDVSKIELMGYAVGRENLAIASGITPDNVSLFTPFCGNFLVSTGISKSFYEFDLQLMKSLIKNVSK